MIPTAVLTAMGLVTAGAWLAGRWRRGGHAVALVLAGNLVFGGWAYFGAYAHQPALRFAWQAKAVDIARYLRDHVPSRPLIFVNYVYGRYSTDVILRDHPDRFFTTWRPGAPVPAGWRHAPEGAVWIVSEADLPRFYALLGEYRVLRRFDRPDGTPTWLVLEFRRPVP